MFSNTAKSDRIIVKERRFPLTDVHQNNIKKMMTYNFPIPIEYPALLSSHEQIKMRSIPEIVGRILALTVVAVKGEGLIQADLLDTMSQLGAEKFLTYEEREFVFCANPSVQELESYAMKHEAIEVLLWILNYKKTMLEPFQCCSPMANKLIIRDHYQTLGNVDTIFVMPVEIVEYADLHYKLCHAIKSMYAEKYLVEGFFIGAVFQRARVLSWLVLDESWD
jgi:hypothetical protein